MGHWTTEYVTSADNSVTSADNSVSSYDQRIVIPLVMSKRRRLGPPLSKRHAKLDFKNGGPLPKDPPPRVKSMSWRDFGIHPRYGRLDFEDKPEPECKTKRWDLL